MILLLCLLCLIGGEPAWSLKEQEFTVKEDIQQVAVVNNTLYVATVKTLYWWVNLKNVIPSQSPETAELPSNFSINMFLFDKTNRLISCGVSEKLNCYCEIRDLKSINKPVYSESIQVGPQRSSSGSVSFLVDVKEDSGQTETYILTAIQNHTENAEEDKCPADLKTINLHNTDHRQKGGLFSRLDQSGSSKPGIQAEPDVEFVDGFQVNSTVYLFSNIQQCICSPTVNMFSNRYTVGVSGDKSNKVHLIWLQAETNKTQTMKSLRGATLSSSGGEGSRLLASSVVPGGQQVLWSGVFSVDKGGESNTELLLFDISPDLSREANTDPDFYTSVNKPNNPSEPKSLKPKAVLFKKKYMNSVLALKQNSWTVFVIGTSKGQLIKLAVDKNNRPACPKEHYRASGNENFISKIVLDPVDHQHIYLQFKKQIKSVAVFDCGEYERVEDCCTDPFCVWCVSKESCTFSKDDCIDDWLSIPDEYQQEVISHRAEKDSTGKVKVVVKVHLTVAQKIRSNFNSHISTTSEQPCRQNEPQPQYPECTCILSDDLTAKELDVTVKIAFSKATLTKQLKLFDCSNISLSCQQCVRAGCGWRENRCTWDSEGERNDSVCQTSSSEASLVKPDITSVSPHRVSYYGRNNATLRGHNLTDVIAVKVQAEMDCSPQESPVWNNTGESLTFHIPSRTNEADAKVCAVLSDGSCHGEADITYQSAPSCTEDLPSATWRSGRKVTLFGSYLESVEMVIHRCYSRRYYQEQEAVPENTNSENLTYETPEGNDWLYWEVFLKVANETLHCSDTMIYYPDPQFPTFISKRTGNDVQVMIQCVDWGLEMTTEELSVWGVKDGEQHPCIMKGKNQTHAGANYFTCQIQNTTHVKFSQLMIKYGRMTVQVRNPPLVDQYLLILRLLLVPGGTAVLVIICQCLAVKNKP